MNLPFATRALIAAHMPGARRYAVWLVPAGAPGRGIGESHPQYRAAVAHYRATGEGRWTDESGAVWSVQEDK